VLKVLRSAHELRKHYPYRLLLLLVLLLLLLLLLQQVA
jgi:hypothetical protein